MELPNFHYFRSKNMFRGSLGGFRYRLEPDGELLRGIAWAGPNCMECTDPERLHREEFPLTEAGLEEARAWLSRKCAELDE